MDEHHQRDADWLVRLRRGDSSALAEIFQSHRPRVFRVAFRLLADEHAAEDVTQETFTRLWEQRDLLRGEAALMTWLYRTCVNRCLNLLRDRRRRAAAERSTALPAAAPEAHDPDNLQIRRDAEARLERLLGALGPLYRPVVVLRDIEGLSYGEIAEVLAIPVGTVMSRLFRARHRLRRLWDELAAGGAASSSSRE